MGSLFRSKFDPQELARRASEAVSIEEGLRILSLLPSRSEFATSNELQTAYAMGLVNLTARSNARQAGEILDKALTLPFYQSHQGARAHHSTALAHAARESARRDMKEGAAIAALTPPNQAMTSCPSSRSPTPARCSRSARSASRNRRSSLWLA